MAPELRFWTPQLRLAAERAGNSGIAAGILSFTFFMPLFLYGCFYILRHFGTSPFAAVGGVLFGVGLLTTLRWYPLALFNVCNPTISPQFGHITRFLWEFLSRIVVCVFAALLVAVQTIARAPIVVLSRYVAIRPRRYNQQSNAALSLEHLCLQCQFIAKKSPILNGTAWYFTSPMETYQHHTETELCLSAQGCHLCSLISRSLLPEPRTAQFATTRLRIHVRIISSTSQASRVVLQAMAESIPVSKALLIEEVPVSDPRRKITTSTSNEHLMEHFRYWIQGCRNHPLCTRVESNMSIYLPLRLLELNSRHPDPPHIRLINPVKQDTQQDHGPGTFEYVALSHCWGNSEILKLSTSKVEEFYNNIVFAELPPTFQHAIEVTLSLGYRHLWIDSLCIVQDSAEDWECQAPQMGLLFANAVCTISATAASNPYGGLYTPGGFLGNCPLVADDNFVLLVRSWAREESALEVLFKEKVDSAPLTTRGWTFQENMLAQRTLHFCHGVVLFECNTIRASEFHSNGVAYAKRLRVRADGRLHSSAVLQRLEVEDAEFEQQENRTNLVAYHDPARQRRRNDAVDVVSVQRNPEYKSQQAKTREIEELSALFGIRGSFQLVMRSTGEHMAEKLEFHNSWYEMVEQYSIRNLTRHTDKLMAVAGVGDFIQNHTLTGRRFLAGLWSDVMVFNLLWVRDDSKPLPVRPDRDLPTWSWASVDGKITHHLKNSNLESSSDSSPQDAISKFQTQWEDIAPLIDQDTVRISAKLTHNGLVHDARLEVLGIILKAKDVTATFSFDVEVDPEDEKLVSLPILRFKHSSTPAVGG